MSSIGRYGLGSKSVVPFGKRGMVRAGGSASRIIADKGTTDSGGEERVSGRGQPAWQLPVGHEHGPSWAFPRLWSHPAEIHGQDNRKSSVLAGSVLGRRNPIVPDSPIGMDGGSPSVSPQCPELGNPGGDAACQRE